MTWPAPQPGLVIRYSYLWQREAKSGLQEGSNDRPCAVVLAVTDGRGRTRVYALPITHSPPSGADIGDAVEIPAPVKARLALDGERSWVILSEANVFTWPGPDLRFVAGGGPSSVAYGMLPPRFFRIVRDRFLASDRARKAGLVPRSE